MARILIVEDDEMSRDMLSRRLARRGHDVCTAPDGEQGIETAQIGLPDLILMDMSLPEIDGWEATRQLKADPATAQIPIIALSAHVRQIERDRAHEAGCDAYETKPVDLERLLATMQRVLGARAPVAAEAPDADPEVPTTPALVEADRLRAVAHDCGWTVDQLVTLYVEQTAEQLGKIAQALTDDDLDEVQRFSHSGAGAAGTCGVDAMVDPMRAIEDAAAEHDTPRCSELIRAAEVRFAAVQEALAALSAADSG